MAADPTMSEWMKRMPYGRETGSSYEEFCPCKQFPPIKSRGNNSDSDQLSSASSPRLYHGRRVFQARRAARAKGRPDQGGARLRFPRCRATYRHHQGQWGLSHRRDCRRPGYLVGRAALTPTRREEGRRAKAEGAEPWAPRPRRRRSRQ